MTTVVGVPSVMTANSASSKAIRVAPHMQLKAEIDATTGSTRVIVRPNEDGTVDEVIVYEGDRCVFHLEQMDEDAYWFAVYPAGVDDRYSFWMDRRKKRLALVMEEAP